MRKMAAQSTKLQRIASRSRHHWMYKPQAMRIAGNHGARRRGTGLPPKPWLVLISAITISIGLIGLGLRQSPSALPHAAAKSISSEVFNWVSQHRKIVTKGPLAELVRQTGEQLASNSDIEDIDWRFFLVRDGTAAYASPDGTIFIHTDILLLANRVDDLAALLAHLMAHVTSGHIGGRITNEFDASKLESLRLTSKEWPLLLRLLNIDGDHYEFSTKQERVAEETALGFIERACYKIQRLPALWARIRASDDPGAIFVDAVHPHNRNSVSEIEQYIEDINLEAISECKQQ